MAYCCTYLPGGVLLLYSEHLWSQGQVRYPRENIGGSNLSLNSDWCMGEMHYQEFWKMLNAGDSGEVTLEQFLAFFWKYFWTRGLDTPGAQISIVSPTGVKLDEVALILFRCSLA